MSYRTLEEYKEEIFDKLNDKQRLEIMYELSAKLCEIEEFVKENKVKRYRVELSEDYDEEICLDADDITTLERIINNEYDNENW